MAEVPTVEREIFSCPEGRLLLLSDGSQRVEAVYDEGPVRGVFTVTMPADANKRRRPPRRMRYASFAPPDPMQGGIPRVPMKPWEKPPRRPNPVGELIEARARAREEAFREAMTNRRRPREPDRAPGPTPEQYALAKARGNVGVILAKSNEARFRR